MKEARINAEKAEVREWLGVFAAAAKGERYRNLWKRLHSMVAVPSRKRPAINLYKLNRHTRDGDFAIVPGKVLSAGQMDHKVTIAAMEFSSGARKALAASGSRIIPIKEMVPASRIRVIV